MIEKIIKTILIITLLISSIVLIFTIPYIVGGLNVSQISSNCYFPDDVDIYGFGLFITLIISTIFGVLVSIFVAIYNSIQPAVKINGKVNKKEQNCYEKI